MIRVQNKRIKKTEYIRRYNGDFYLQYHFSVFDNTSFGNVEKEWRSEWHDKIYALDGEIENE